jgi:hypothetical protein
MYDLSRAAPHVALAVGVAERSNSIALRDNALLVAAMIDGGMTAGMPIEADQEIVAHAIAGVVLHGEGRDKYVQMHRRLAALARRNDLNPSAYGDCVPAPSAELHAISRAA